MFPISHQATAAGNAKDEMIDKKSKTTQSVYIVLNLVD